MENNSQAPKRRGRPKGSKNKKTKVAATNPSESIEGDGMGSHLHILEVPAGCDVIAAVYDFACRHQLGGLAVVSLHGIVRNVTVCQPNMPSPFHTDNSDYKLLFLMGNFYGSSSSIRAPSPFSARHIASFVNGEGDLYVGVIEGQLLAETNVFVGVSFINGTESITQPLPPPPPPSPPRALPASQLFFDLDGSMRTATAGLPSGAARSRTATAALPEFSSGAGRFRTATDGLPEFSSGAGMSRTAYGVPTAPSPSPLISCLMTNNFSSSSGSNDSDRSIVRENLVKRDNNY